MPKQKKVSTAISKPAAELIHELHTSAGVLRVAGAPDRVWYSFGCKLQVVQYESVDFNIGHASDVRHEESPQEALVRVATLVHDAASQTCNQIRNMSQTGTPEPVRDKPKGKSKKHR